MPPDLRSTIELARPAEKRTSTNRPDPALVRRAVTAMVELSASAGQPMRREQAREVVLAYATGDDGHAPDGWSHWLRDWFGIADPTGESTVRNVMREV